MRKLLVSLCLLTFALSSFANEIHSSVKIKEVIQFNDSVFVDVDEGLTICNFGGTKGCVPILVGYILSSTLFSTNAVDLLVDAKENKKLVNLTTGGVEQGYFKIISVELVTK